MALQPIRTSSFSHQVFGQLVQEILDGTYAAGSSLPSERSLSDMLDVNRHVIREAIKRLEQAGLVKVSQGGATRVLDYKKHAGLDLLTLMAEGARPGADVLKHWLSMLEMRAAVAADLVRLCALRASRQIKNDLVAIATQMRAASEAHGDGQEVFALEVRFWDRVHDGADNLPYRLAYNTMMRSTLAVADLTQTFSLQEVRKAGYREELARLIHKGDAEGAETHVRVQMRKGLERFAKVVAIQATPEVKAPGAAAASSTTKKTRGASKRTRRTS